LQREETAKETAGKRQMVKRKRGDIEGEKSDVRDIGRIGG
jgi:hypothetical protein